MESGDGVEVELNNGNVDKAPDANGFSSHLNKENEIVDNGAAAVHVTNCSDDATKVEVLDSPKDGDDGSASATQNKASNPAKKGASSGSSQLKKAQKSSTLLNGPVVQPQKKTNILSHSLSFPSKGSIKSSSYTRQSKVASANTNVGLAAKATTSSTQKKMVLNIASREAVTNDTSEDAQLNDNKTKPPRLSLPAKLDDDAQSSASSSTPRTRKSTGNGFSFKLDERAEKRKEFFMKLEEKNHAKEMEKTNLQAKSKENQEAEIRRLRKTLTFKATPMPSFYQEPGPPKVELKKIPPTRARSPKLGRRKESAPATNNTSEAGNSCESPRLTPSSSKPNEGTANSKGITKASKNPKQNALPKLSSQKSKAMKSDSNSDAKNNASDAKAKLEQVCKIEDDENRHAQFSEAIDAIESVIPTDRKEEEKAVANLRETDNTPQETPVQG